MDFGLWTLDPIDLRATLERMLGEHFGRQVHIAKFDRRPFAYRTSFGLEEINVVLEEGLRLELLLKDLSRAGLQRTALQAKPDFLHNPRREIEVYRQILAESELGTATCYGAVIEAEKDRYWLVLERVQGRELYQIGDRSQWQEAARWLARMHCRFADHVEELRRKAPLLRHDADFYRVWIERVDAFRPQVVREGGTALWTRLLDGYQHVIEQLQAMPTTLIHGEFYASNVLVDDRRDPWRVCPVDWEMAAAGPGLIDMAALTAGRWTDDERLDLVKTYWRELAEYGKSTPLEQLLTDLAYCRLHLAVQWLGWSPDWTPPAEHAHDWLADAMQLAETLGL